MKFLFWVACYFRTFSRYLLLLITCLLVTQNASATIGSAEDLDKAEKLLLSSSGEDKAELIFEIIEYQLLGTNYDAAYAYTDLLAEVIKPISTPLLQARYHLCLARLKLHQDERLDALFHTEEARIYAEKGNDPKVNCEVYRSFGNVFMMMRDYSKALEYFQNALSHAEDLEDNHLSIMALNSIAICYWRMKEWNQAELYLRQAKEQLELNSRMSFLIDNNIAVALIEQGKFREAEDKLIRAFEFNSENQNSYGYALNCSNFGDLYQRMGQNEKALKFLGIALEFGQNNNNQFILARSLRHKAKVYFSENKTAEAVDLCYQSIKYSQEMDDPAEEMDSWQTVFGFLEESGQYKEALEAFQQINALSEKILSDQTRINSALFSIQFKTAQREKEMATLIQQKRIQNLQRNSILAALLIAIIFSIALYLRYRFHQKANAQISAQKEVIERNHSALQQANERLEKMNLEKDEILGIASHDLRNPMGATRELAIMLKEDWKVIPDIERNTIIENIIISADMMLDIVSKLLDLNRIEQGGVTVKKELLDPRSFIQNSVSKLNAIAARKKQTITVHPSQATPWIKADSILFQQVMDNLLSNALKYSPANTKVDVSFAMGKNAKTWLISIKDEGPGIPPDELSRLFQKFARLSSQPTGGETSTGLGLSIVHKLVELMNGRVWCESKLGEGSTFFVEFPSVS